jgi:hypothetical protein
MQEIADLASINADETEKIGSVGRALTLRDTPRVWRTLVVALTEDLRLTRPSLKLRRGRHSRLYTANGAPPPRRVNSGRALPFRN